MYPILEELFLHVATFSTALAEKCYYAEIERIINKEERRKEKEANRLASIPCGIPNDALINDMVEQVNPYDRHEYYVLLHCLNCGRAQEHRVEALAYYNMLHVDAQYAENRVMTQYCIQSTVYIHCLCSASCARYYNDGCDTTNCEECPQHTYCQV